MLTLSDVKNKKGGARLIDLQELKDYAEKNITFNTIDLKMNFRIDKTLAMHYCRDLVDAGVVKQIGETVIYKRPTRIFKYIGN